MFRKWSNFLFIFLTSLRISNSIHVVSISLKLSSDFGCCSDVSLAKSILLCAFVTVKLFYLIRLDESEFENLLVKSSLTVEN